jgi:hypothetical protein
VFKDLQRVNKVGTSQHITTHADAKTLPEASSCCRRNSLVAQRPRLGHNADITRREAWQRLEADTTSADSGDDAGAVSTDKAGFGLGLEHRVNLDGQSENRVF